jgi:uncharacterized protein (DUF885 family)
MKGVSWSLAIRTVLIAVLAVFSAGPSTAAPAGDFDRLVDRYLAGYYAFRPGRATQDGVHEHDALLAGFRREEIAAETARLRSTLAELEALKPAGLDSTRRVDHAILTAHLQAELLELENIRRWEKDPNYYVDLVSDAIYALAARSFAPPADRMKSVIGRERMIGTVLASAIENLSNPPRIWTEVAIEQAEGGIEFLKVTVPEAFSSVADTALKTEFNAANDQAIRELQGFVNYLREDLLPASRGDFRLGPELFEKKLQYEEMCEVPLYRLERYGEEELTNLQKRIELTAAAIEAGKTPRDLFRVLSTDHPSPARLVPETERLLESLRQFCVDKNIVTFPSEERVGVRATPEFMRSYVFAAMDAPGPFETKGREAFYFVTPPATSWDRSTQDDHMRTYNRYALPIVSMHEAYPGHFLQFQWNERTTSKVRKVFGCTSFSEGWGLYCEGMMLDEGYENNDPRYRLFQLRLALLRTCRYLVGIRMHTGSMTYEQAVDFFIKEGYQERVNAEREARRGTSDPTYLVYQLGKMQILKLREDYKRFRGSQFTLKEFHDRLLAHGSPPVKLLRTILMPGDKGTVL